MASAGGRRVIIQHSHRLTATLQRPQPPPLFPPSPTSKSPSLGLASLIRRQKHSLQAKAASVVSFFLKKIVRFHCWRKPEPSVWPQSGFPRADVLGASTHAALQGQALEEQSAWSPPTLPHRPMKAPGREIPFHWQWSRLCSGPGPTPVIEVKPWFMLKKQLPVCASPGGATWPEHF